MNHAVLNFPNGKAEVLFAGYGESFDPSIERTEMERGMPKQRVINSQVLMKVRATLFFRTAADQQAFEDWYFDVLKRIGSFQMEHPRTGVMTEMRFENASIGDLVPLHTQFRLSKRDVVFEYLR
ncbi:hypothetical protein [Pseudoxanthomonas winnipegensis]|uniref:Uncharacterized protein n=1 Tax=Pseudoxanthomonas winnipegensis TaxID=2480810 RepID=A0A4Q8LAP3_9GAMM|nr:hypothetical protein [Pseudoxanthomonas winnipegensis]TAA25389.1 hypothetical protein EA660_07970 [Pseudoxanthomonas winnipegensis]